MQLPAGRSVVEIPPCVKLQNDTNKAKKTATMKESDLFKIIWAIKNNISHTQKTISNG